jgi:hypothetical protein
MSESVPNLSEQQAYNEAMSYHFNYNSREFKPGDYNRFSQDFDASRAAISSLTDEQIKDLHKEAFILARRGDDEQAEKLDRIIWHMPFIDQDRAFTFYESIISDPGAEIDLLTVVTAGMRQMTFVNPERSIGLWKLGFKNKEIDNDRLANPFWSAASDIFNGGTLIEPAKVELVWNSFTDEEKSETLINRVSILRLLNRASEALDDEQ